uniref:C2H2-type domain-containing protein n=2 Tax=Macrostomum lignano TaxID=282301 RepID=A0A1I8G543_9PLAT
MPPATDGRLWECRVCLRRFRLERQLRQHQLQHTDRRPHRCHRCLTGFATPAGLAQHAGSTARCLAPTKQTGVRCFVCKRAMFGLSALRRHLISAHCSVVAGACLACQLDFPSVEELQQHMLASHTSSITLSSGPDSVRLQRCRLCPPPAAAFHSDLAPLLRHLASEVHCAAACWRCCLCQRTFADHLAVRRHVAGHLVGQRIHLCPAGCSRLFAT